MTKKGIVMAGIFAMLASLFSSCSAEIEKKPNSPSKKTVESGVINISWSSSGDSLGCHYSNSIQREENGEYFAIVHNQPTHNANPKITKVKVAKFDMDALFNHIQKNYEYKNWGNYPPSKIEVLDAASSSVSMDIKTVNGYEHYSLSDSREIPKGQKDVFYDIRRFVESYTIKNAQTVNIERHGFYGNPAAETLEIDNPAMLRVESSKKYANPFSKGNGREFTIKYVFRGRIPGETKLRFTSRNLVVPLEYKAVVDKKFNLTLERIK